MTDDLYRQDEVLEAVGRGDRVWVASDPSDCDDLIRAGAVATCAEFRLWGDLQSRHLAGADVAIAVSRFEPTGAEMLRIAQSLRGVARDVTFRLPVDGCKSLNDHFRGGYGMGDLVVVNKFTVMRLAGDLDHGLAPDVLARFVPGGSFVLDVPDHVPAVWGRGDDVLWSEGEGLLLCGPAGVGKTTVAAQLVKCRLGATDETRGLPVTHEVLGLPVTPGEGRVLYLACDRPKQTSRVLHRIFDGTHRALLNERLTVWQGPPPEDLARHPDLLLRLAQAALADTVVIDSLKDVAIGLSSDDVGAGLNNAIQQTVVEGVEVLGLHHLRKNGPADKPKSIDDVYGSTWITAGAGSVVLLWGTAGDLVVELRQLKQPAAEVGPWQVEHDHVRGVSTVLSGFDALTFLRGRPKGATATETAGAWFGTERPTENQRKKAERTLKRLVADQLARRRDGERVGFGGSDGVRYVAVDSRLQLVGDTES